MRVDADDFARPCSCGREHQIAVKEILIEAGAVEKLEEEMSEGMLREYISPLVICDTNTYVATEELMEDIYDRCQVLVLDAEGLQADRHAIKIVENNMEEDIDLIVCQKEFYALNPQLHEKACHVIAGFTDREEYTKLIQCIQDAQNGGTR